MNKRWLLLIPLALFVAVGAWFEPTRSVRGWVRGEPFFQGRSAGYWEQRLLSTEPLEQARVPEMLEAGKAGAVPVLVRLLDSPRQEVRWNAASILGKIGGPAADAVPALLEKLDDRDPYVRAVAAQSLAAIKPNDPAVIKALIAKLKTKDRDQAIRPLSAARAAARDAVPDLIEIVSDTKTSPGARWEAIRTLGKIGPDSKAAVPTLIEALKDKEDLVREHAAESLGEIGDSAAVPHLARACDDEAKMVRRDAVRSLGQIGPAAKSALPAVEKLLKDKEELVRDAAKSAMRSIDPERKRD